MDREAPGHAGFVHANLVPAPGESSIGRIRTTIEVRNLDRCRGVLATGVPVTPVSDRFCRDYEDISDLRIRRLRNQSRELVVGCYVGTRIDQRSVYVDIDLRILSLWAVRRPGVRIV